MLAQNSVLVTYKGKILLKSLDNFVASQNVWGFIGEEKSWKKSGNDIALKEAKLSTKLNLDKVSEVLHLDSNKKSLLFCVKLTDGHVNSIVRIEGQRLEFYSLKEAEKLPLSISASHIIGNYMEELKKLTQD